jgi:hypothetical protein
MSENIGASSAAPLRQPVGSALGEEPQLHLSQADEFENQNFERLRNLLRDRTRSVAEGYQNGAYIVGRPGSSKTYTVLEQLRQLDISYVYRNAKMTAPGLWNLLHEHPEGVTVLDDIPSVVAERPAQMILLAALGGDPGMPRTITYTTAEADGRKAFQYRGSIIAISNVPLRRDPLADAVQSRVPLLEFEPTDAMLAAFMRYLAIRGQPDLLPKECLEVAEFIIGESRASEYRLDLRLMTKAWGDYRLWKQGRSICHWQELVLSSMKLTLPRIIAPISSAAQKAQEVAFVQELLAQYPGKDGTRQRQDQWKERTGKSADTLYRHERALRPQGIP